MELHLSQDASVLEMLKFFAPRILIAVFCGGMIGWEREVKQKSAGIKTNMLICVGASLYTALSVLISTRFSEMGFLGDPARISAQIVSGIGFLGGGAIIQSRGTVTGLTTAATIWVVAAIGVAVGLGHYSVAVAASVIVILILIAVSLMETVLMGKLFHFVCEVTIDQKTSGVRQSIQEILNDHELSLEDFRVTPVSGEREVIKLKYWGRKPASQKFVLVLWGMQGIIEVKQR